MDPETTTIEEARQYLRKHLYGDGTECPCCKQHAEVYDRSITSAMCWGLAEIYSAYKQDWAHVTKFLKSNDRVPQSVRADITKFKYWMMIEPAKKSGVWRITDTGKAFLLDGLEAPKKIFIYNDEILKQSDETVTFEQASNNRFSFKEVIKNPASRLS